MTGYIPRTVLGLSASLCLLAGCTCYRELVDPCWPERYNSMARQSVNEAALAQSFNGHVLDQTIWNYHFEHDPATGAPTARLNAAGIEHLDYLSRRRPAADLHIFLATAHDVPGLAHLPVDKAIGVRTKLNEDRIAAIKNYLAIQTGPGTAWAIEVHDPAEVYLAAPQIAGTLPWPRPREVIGAYQKLQDNFQGGIAAESGTTGTGQGGGGQPGSAAPASGGSSPVGGPR
jgi:hypothetical protein